jgi:hypothetical protein
MSEANADDLVTARAKLVEDRRAGAKMIAGPYKRGQTEHALRRIVELETVIHAIDRALEDERRRGSI